MGIFTKDDGRGIERWYIELPDSVKDRVVYKWPDQQIRRGSKVNVDADYEAVFLNRGVLVATLPPGRHELEDGGGKLTAWISDHLTAERSIDAELFFVRTRPTSAYRFGGYVDTVQDTSTGLAVRLRVFGECSWHVSDPAGMLVKLVGTDGLDEAGEVDGWLTGQLLAAVRQVAAGMLSERGVLALGSWQQELEDTAREVANASLSGYGMEVDAFGQLNLNVEDEDLDKLQQITERAAYVRMAGSYEQYARGEALVNLGSGESGSDAGLVSMMLLGALGQPGGKTSEASLASSHECRSCGKAAAGRFCSECGTAQVCPQCSARLESGPHCPGCGIPA